MSGRTGMNVWTGPVVSEGEADEIASLEKRIFADPWSFKAVYDAVKDPRAMVLSAKEKGHVIGYCLIYFAADEAEMARFAVKELFRRQGVGRTLFNRAVKLLTEKNVKRVFLEVRESNAAARAFYLSNGFTAVGRRKGFYAKPEEDAVLMRYDILNVI